MKSGNEEVAASLCLKYGLRLGDGQRAPLFSMEMENHS